MNDLYTLIGSSKDAPTYEIRANIESRLKEEQSKHDAGDQAAAVAMFNLREAKHILLDEKKREIYNAKINQPVTEPPVHIAGSDSSKLSKCSACSGTISKYSKTCPHCGHPIPSMPIELLGKYYVWGTVLFLATVWSFAHWSNQEKQAMEPGLSSTSKTAQQRDDRRSHPAILSKIERKPRNTDLSIAAFIICKNHIENRLKSPSTADFPFLDYSSVNLGENRYVIKSYVDSQNSFGAMIRTSFLCQLRFVGPDQSDIRHWVLEGISTKP